MKKYRHLCIVIFLSILLPLNAFKFARDYKFHSVFVYNFTKYIQWPNASNEFNIGILGGDPGAMESFKTMAEIKSSGSSKFIVTNVNNASQASNCQILFIPEGASNQLESIAGSLAGKPVLIITEKSGLIKKGSCINFITVDGKLNIELNREAVEGAGLKVSGQLMALAILV